MEVEIFCSFCGFKNTQNTFFCDNCGSQFNFDINPNAPDFESISENFEEDKFMDFSSPPIQTPQNFNMQPVTLNILGMSDSLPPSNYLTIDPQNEHNRLNNNNNKKQQGGSSKPKAEILAEGKIIIKKKKIL